MKFTITRERLQEGLLAVANAVPSKTTLPVLSNILVEAIEGGIRLSGTDLDIAVSTVVPAEVDTEGPLRFPHVSSWRSCASCRVQPFEWRLPASSE